MPYRIPFHVVVSGSVATLSGLGVPGAIVKYCRIDPNTGLRDKNTDFCPLKTFVTDLFGTARLIIIPHFYLLTHVSSRIIQR